MVPKRADWTPSPQDPTMPSRQAKGRLFGPIPGVEVGTLFEGRKQLLDAGVHRPLVAGISGSGVEGADSVVASGGYEDDVDEGDLILYTGHGGRKGELTIDPGA